jgi:hypothetical protein
MLQLVGVPKKKTARQDYKMNTKSPQPTNKSKHMLRQCSIQGGLCNLQRTTSDNCCREKKKYFNNAEAWFPDGASIIFCRNFNANLPSRSVFRTGAMSTANRVSKFACIAEQGADTHNVGGDTTPKKAPNLGRNTLRREQSRNQIIGLIHRKHAVKGSGERKRRTNTRIIMEDCSHGSALGQGLSNICERTTTIGK